MAKAEAKIPGGGNHCCNCLVVMVSIVLLVLILGASPVPVSSAAPQVSAIFAFGDSLIDSGNNNYMRTIARANYWPYGCDFSAGPTGRFSNGKTVLDMLGEMLDVPYLPAFADPSTTGNRVLRGVNYASAAGGILDETGRHWGDRFSLSQQVINFESVTLLQLRTAASTAGVNLSHYLAKSITVLSFGSNDYINNYLQPSSLYPSSSTYSPSDFANLLIDHYSRQILALYNLGLRKFFIAGLGPLGCIPSQRATPRARPGRCADSVNQILGGFNDGLRSLVDRLNGNHPGAVFVYANTYGATGDILNNPTTYGMKVLDRGCCGVSNTTTTTTIMTCLPYQTPCNNRNEFVFWDAYHTTEAVNSILAHRAFSGNAPADCYPINLQQLALV